MLVGPLLILWTSATVFLVAAAFYLFRENRNLKNRLGYRDSQVEELNRRRTDFVANVSHELKTPLTSIRGYTETLQDGAIRDPEMAQQFLARIEDNAQRLDSLVHDILDLSRLEATDTYLHYENIDLDSFLQAVREQFSIRLEKKKQILNIENNVKSLRADKKLVEQAVTNLVGNANRYCQEGAIVEVRSSSAHEEGQAWTQIEVNDNGPGIPESELSRIFERFYRADKSRNRQFGGTGLGLAIVKHIMLSHRGRAVAELNSDGGMRFRLLFPPNPER